MHPRARRLMPLALAIATAASPAQAAPARGTAAPRAHGGTGASQALAHGRWEEVLALTAARRPGDAASQVFRAEALAFLGRQDEAQRELTLAYHAEPTNLALAGALLRALRSDLPVADADPEQRSPLATLRAALHQVWRSGRWSAARLDDVLTMAELARQENRWADANRLLRDGARSFPRDPRANLLWGETFLEKHAAGDAETSFRAALAIAPDDATAHVGLARAALQLRYDVATASSELSRALKTNPRLPDALFLQGELALDAEEFEEVEAQMARLERDDPRGWRTAALRAALALLRGDDASYEAVRLRLRGSSAVGHFYAFVAEALGRHRRYDVSARVGRSCREETAVYAPCLAVLGTTYLRLGQEDAGLEALRATFALDPFDERVFNQLQLFEKTIPARYETLVRGPFRFRFPKGRRAALETSIAPFLEATFEGYRARYGYAPPAPLDIELYADHATYALRVAGTPELAVSAVCFGQVIATEMPPTPGTNWGLVLAHELGHVFALGLSHNRVPRWFTEGLADREAARLRPEWRRQHGRLIWSALARRSLPAMHELSRAFVLATSADEAVLAYVLSGQAVGFLETRGGFPALRAALVAFGEGRTEGEILSGWSAGGLAELERAFLDQLRADVRRFEDQYLPLEARLAPPLPDFGEDALSPSDLAQRALGEGLRALERSDELAARAAETKLAAWRTPEARAASAFLTSSRLLGAEDPEGAYRTLAPLLASEERAAVPDGYDVRRLLAEAAFRSGKLDAAELQIRRAIALDPERIEPRRFLARLVLDVGRRPASVRIEVLRGLLARDPTDGARARELLDELARVGDQQSILEAASFARFVDPADPLIPWQEGQAARALAQTDQAIASFERALALDPPVALKRVIAKALAESRPPPRGPP